ncbi:unnamed protein product [Spirodela intermedia]|uniref:protein-serine/threonine phosphatase n=1 Tax=Spirodela intermedia TaxID=51605 RepID=A0A7I8IDF9_SPIIN|nr:unnamed protein product [Spirodela intermedia]CAA6655828.1 unnamed protein product [Spirodela intermedia]
MFSWMARMAAACWRPVRRYARMSKDEEEDDALLWSRDVERHSGGIPRGLQPGRNRARRYFRGIYDGHGGPDASRFISDHLFVHLMRLAREGGTISEDIIRRAFSATEEGFLALVRRTHEIKPLMAAVGSCCLVGIIWKGTLFAANLGDSRAVVGRLGRSNAIIAEQVTEEHNASLESVRRELMASHPDDSHIVVLRQGVWRIKGIIQIYRRCVLEEARIPRRSIVPRFRLPEPLRRPVLTAEPAISVRVLRPQDKFLIFASDGLWEHLTNQEAAELVHKYPRAGIARRLVRRALEEAMRKREMRYEDLKKIKKEARRFFHDDITVVVVFIDSEFSPGQTAGGCQMSVRGFVDSAGPSEFSILDGM